MIFFIRKIIQISKLVSCEWTSGVTSMTRQTKILLTEIKIISLSWFLAITVSEQCDQVVHNSAQTQRNDSAEMPLKLEGDNERWNEWIDMVDDGYKECQLLWKPQDNPGFVQLHPLPFSMCVSLSIYPIMAICCVVILIHCELTLGDEFMTLFRS